MPSIAPGLEPARTAAAAAWLCWYALLFALLALLLPPDSAQRAAADPLLQIMLPPLAPCLLALLPVGVALCWWRRARPDVAELRLGLRWTLFGALAGLAATGAIRLLHGDTLPAFVPPEESAAPGIVLGVGAGLVEESLFRLLVLPLAFFALRQRCGSWLAAALACFITGLLFALSHEPGSATFDAVHFVTRLVIPGMAMSAVALLLHPAFMVSAHVSAHVLIALLFVVAPA